MRYFFDTEFVDRPWALELISIGVVAEDGREFYAVTDFPQWSSPDWIKQNVVPRLQPKRAALFTPRPLLNIRSDLLAFIGDDDVPEFWAYYAAHDWVALCWLMGGMMSLPEGWPMLCNELRAELPRGISDEGRDDEHNALADARWVRGAWKAHCELRSTP